MKKYFLLLATVSSTLFVNGQYTETFETPDFGVLDSAWWGQDQLTDGDTIFSNGPLNFELNYNSTFQSFTGFAVSSWTDDTTPGWGNQFSAATGGGALMSEQYAVCYASQWGNNRVFLDDPSTQGFFGMTVTNTTYAYQSMLNGDAVGKPFGSDTSATGVIDGTNGEDWFLLTIYALGADSLQTGDSINFYLADYTGGNTYISQNWEPVSLLPLYTGTAIHGLDFVLTSSDTTGGFGMNTPAYFAMDNLTISDFVGINTITQDELSVYPNPTNGNLTVTTNVGAQLSLFDLNGRLIQETTAKSSQVLWNLEDLESGIYMLISNLDGQRSQTKLVKQ